MSRRTMLTVSEYLDHNELALAYEILASATSDPTGLVRERLASAATRMGVEEVTFPHPD
jgi:hypothetical protein